MNGVPGSKYNYCSINAFLTVAIIENARHMPWMSSREAICVIHWQFGTIPGGTLGVDPTRSRTLN
jgi:hypothetical protein